MRNNNIFRVGAVVFCAICAVAIVAARGETIHLKDGKSLRGEVIARKADRVFVDMGFTVVEVPADSIDRIEEDAAEATGASTQPADSSQLWRADNSRTEMTVKQNVERCGPGVVQVRTGAGLGSGFIIHPEGYLLTNDHVVAGEHEISITVYGEGAGEIAKEQFNKVRIIATSPDMDLALLKIEAEGRTFPTVPLGDSDQIRQGQDVFAIGSPLGLERSVSRGIVSLKNREQEGKLYIQTTTQINPGNSGGPLFNLNGQVVGVTNMKIITPGTEGLGFAIPVNSVKFFLANREAFAFDPRNPNAGFRYYRPPDVEQENLSETHE